MKKIEDITDLSVGQVLEDISKESGGAKVTDVTANSVGLWMKRCEDWYIVKETCVKCGTEYQRTYRAGKTDKLTCSKFVGGYTCAGKTFAESGKRSFTGVDATQYMTFDKFFKERFLIKDV